MPVRVVARIRPLLDREHDRDIIVRADTARPGEEDAPAVVRIPNPKNESEEFSFGFSQVYDQATTQEALFAAEVSPHVRSLFQGLDVTIFAYGVTGTGKTHTMRGGLRRDDRGVIPRLLSAVFRRARRLSRDSAGAAEIRVALSYYEIYNDRVYDLLQSPERRAASGLPLRERDGRTVVVGLSERACDGLADFEQLYIEANRNRATAATALNAHSSRSHAILRVRLTQAQTGADGTVAIRESTVSAIDLAGSEDNRRTDNGRERLVESAAINKSLFVLGQCIDAIARGDRRIPYRESKMTRILSLGQNSGVTVMILNLAPVRDCHLDTLSSLNVSSRAKRIEVREIENEIVFKQPSQAMATTATTTTTRPGESVSRKPLRPLANSAHNTASGPGGAGAGKPVRAFSVYTDGSKPAAATGKRPASDPEGPPAAARPTKMARPALAPKPIKQLTAISAADIEAMVERKVGEILASRAAEPQPRSGTTNSAPVQPAAPAEIAEAVQRRLDALERRIDGEKSDRDRAAAGSPDGIELLVRARQARRRRDDGAALELYQQAVPFFPDEPKLLAKIERLRAKLDSVEAPQPTPAAETESERKERRKKKMTQDGEGGGGGGDRGDHEEALKRPPRPASTAGSSKAESDHHDDEHREQPWQTPRTRLLLDIVNSRDPARIRALAGFGAKRAGDLVARLEDAGGVVETLAQLRSLQGMGGRTVERAHEGLGAV